MRNMSFALTTSQVRRRHKTVTRRMGEFWTCLRPGDQVRAVNKSQGLKAGERVAQLAILGVVSVGLERLGVIDRYPQYGRMECAREGFPGMTPAEFVRFFCKANRCKPSAIVTRIEFVYLPVRRRKVAA